jgi:hypothetical protein
MPADMQAALADRVRAGAELLPDLISAGSRNIR